MNSSFSNRISAYFGALFLVAIGILFSLWYFGLPQFGLIGASDQRLAEAMRILEVKADLQYTLIAKGIKERRGDVLVFSENKSLSQQLEIGLDLFNMTLTGSSNACSAPTRIVISTCLSRTRPAA